ncbi:MAG: hypothetical protein HY898_26500 [Deltaproteobacteria bacterium]|nr:hypothetical protein [Deltaproteobacteria bacterium]
MHQGLERRILIAAGWMLLWGVTGCLGASSPLRATAPEVPTGQAKCKVAASHENPLVTEWPAPEKANLEALLRQGTVVVSYSGCAMKLLPHCRTRGYYGWRRTTTSTDTLEIRNAEDLYAKLPLGAVSLEGELARSGRISVQTTVAGQIELQQFDPATMATDPYCEGATHVLGALSLGAFKMRSGGAISARGGAGVPTIGSGSASTSSEETVMREAGTPDSCKMSTDQGVHPDCSSPIQVFLRPLPKYIADRGPAGTVKVDFLSGGGNEPWDVRVGDRVICKTPCEKWVDPAMPFMMELDAGFLRSNHKADVPDLREHPAQSHLRVLAYPRSDGKFVGGIVATTFGGLGVATGIVLTAVGCTTDDKKMCGAGAITIPLSGVLLASGIWLTVSGLPRAEVSRTGSVQAPRILGLGGTF